MTCFFGPVRRAGVPQHSALDAVVQSSSASGWPVPSNSSLLPRHVLPGRVESTSALFNLFQLLF